MRRAALVMVVAAVSASAAAAPFTPGARELAEALATPGHPAHPTHVHCSGPSEEPTEFSCNYRLPGGARCRTWIAIDGPTWVLIDAPACRRRTG